jgi:hypothetical protein
VTARLLTPSKITAWLSCEHALTLQHQLESGAMAPVAQPFGSFARLLANKGLEHEAECLSAYRAQGLSILEIPDREPCRDGLPTGWTASATRSPGTTT